MAMWFVHLEAVEVGARELGAVLDRSALAWGAVVCDVDKVSRASRAESHLVQLPRPFTVPAFASALGLEQRHLDAHCPFLCGVLSHLVVDDAWYSGLWAALRQHRVPGFTDETMRALNLLLDMQARARIRVAGLSLAPCPGEALLPFLTPRRVTAMRAAMRFYLAWDGDIARVPSDPAFALWARWFRDLLDREGPKLEPFLAQLDQATLMERVCASSARAMAELLEHRPS